MSPAFTPDGGVSGHYSTVLNAAIRRAVRCTGLAINSFIRASRAFGKTNRENFLRNRHTFGAVLAATLGATLVLASPTLLAAKPGGGGGSGDACNTPGLDFPAFAYRIPGSGRNPSTINVADATGKCSRMVTAGSNPKFSYPIDGTANKGRVVWLEGNTIYAVDLTVGAGNIITVDARRPLTVNAGCCALDLSKDGQTVYFTDTDTSLATLNVRTLSVNQIFALPSGDLSWFFMEASVNGDGTQLYATKYGFQSPNEGASQLVRVDLTTAPATAVLLREWLSHPGYGANIFSPAADQYADRVAFLLYIEGTNNCTPLVVTNRDGTPLIYGPTVPARYGQVPTWVGNNVVMVRRGPMDGSGKCGSTTSLAQIDLTTNAETVLTTGYNPNGR